MTTNNRRKFIRNAVAGAGFLSLPSLLQAQPGVKMKPRKIVCAGGHPDDPETCCGGTVARLTAAGHEVTIVYLTGGEAGIPGRSHADSAAIRHKEGLNACSVLKAKPVFVGQIDGASVVNNEWIAKIQALLEAEQPDIVFTHWPVDMHPDHQAMPASLMSQAAEEAEGKLAVDSNSDSRTSLFARPVPIASERDQRMIVQQVRTFAVALLAGACQTSEQWRREFLPSAVDSESTAR